MVVLLNQFWPWMVIGAALICWGMLSLRFDPSQWVKILTTVFFSGFSDSTKSEKRESASVPIEDVVSSNTGCALVLLGLIFLGYGIIRWIQ